jgi:transposase-like protein
MQKRKRRSFTDAYKAEVVELVRKGGKSIGAISLNRRCGAAAEVGVERAAAQIQASLRPGRARRRRVT